MKVRFWQDERMVSIYTPLRRYRELENTMCSGSSQTFEATTLVPDWGGFSNSEFHGHEQ
jgi:hypothetical protein